MYPIVNDVCGSNGHIAGSREALSQPVHGLLCARVAPRTAGLSTASMVPMILHSSNRDAQPYFSAEPPPQVLSLWAHT